MKNDIRAAACGTGKFGNELRADSIQEKPAAERTDLPERTCGTRGCSPPPGGGCGLLRFLPEPQIQHSKFKIQNCQSGRNLRRSRTKQTNRMRAAGLRRAKLRPAAVPSGTANSAFKIQDSKLPIGAQLAKEPHTSGLADASCGPPPPPGCGPHGLFKVEIQHSGFNMKCTPIPAASNPTAARAFRRSAPAPVFTSRNTSPTAPWRR